MMSKIRQFKLKIEDSHLRVFAHRNPPAMVDIKTALGSGLSKEKKEDDWKKWLGLLKGVKENDLYIYVLTNRKLNNNMQSPIEVEVFKWSDQGVETKDAYGKAVAFKRHIVELENVGKKVRNLVYQIKSDEDIKKFAKELAE